jgi:hypothetical protein
LLMWRRWRRWRRIIWFPTPRRWRWRDKMFPAEQQRRRENGLRLLSLLIGLDDFVRFASDLWLFGFNFIDLLLVRQIWVIIQQMICLFICHCYYIEYIIWKVARRATGTALCGTRCCGLSRESQRSLLSPENGAISSLRRCGPPSRVGLRRPVLWGLWARRWREVRGPVWGALGVRNSWRIGTRFRLAVEWAPQLFYTPTLPVYPWDSLLWDCSWPICVCSMHR